MNPYILFINALFDLGGRFFPLKRKHDFLKVKDFLQTKQARDRPWPYKEGYTSTKVQTKDVRTLHKEIMSSQIKETKINGKD